MDGMELHSLFVGDIALEVTDLLLQTYFQQFFPSVNSAKVGGFLCIRRVCTKTRALAPAMLASSQL